MTLEDIEQRIRQDISFVWTDYTASGMKNEHNKDRFLYALSEFFDELFDKADEEDGWLSSSVVVKGLNRVISKHGSDKKEWSGADEEAWAAFVAEIKSAKFVTAY